MEFVAIVALLAILQYIYFAVLVAQARGRFGVNGPAVTGHPVFERYFRVQMNTLELLIAAIVLGVVNAFVRPLAFILTLPLTVLTLGLFLLVLNAGMVALVAWLVPGFQVAGFWTAVGAALIVSLVSWAASSVIGSNGKVEMFTRRR